MTQQQKKRVLFGRRQGRSLGQLRRAAVEDKLPLYDLAGDLEKAESGMLEPCTLFPQALDQYWLEIGFGDGGHLHAQVMAHPDYGFLGAEPFINGVSALLKELPEKGSLPNIRILADDALKICDKLADGVLDGIYLLNPDPWHKKRHHKRRMINPENLDLFSRILKPGGKLIMTTDVPDLAEWMCRHALLHPSFKWTANKADDWRIKPKNWIDTRYQTKGAKGADQMVYLFFERH